MKRKKKRRPGSGPRRRRAPAVVGRPDCQLKHGPRCQLTDGCRFPAQMFGVACRACYWQLPEFFREGIGDGEIAAARSELARRNAPGWRPPRRLVLRLRPRRWIWETIET